MGRKSRMKKVRRIEAALQGGAAGEPKSGWTERARELEVKLNRLADGDCEFGPYSTVDDKTRAEHLQDILDFEDVRNGTSLFLGLQRRGVDLPPPERLNENQSARKVRKIFKTLSRVGVFFIGFEEMTPRELYSKLWHETLWEGCYPEQRRQPGLTLMDVSHSMSKSELKQAMREIVGPALIH